ncbi:paraquat-inducible protein A [Luteibacter rhizovicinus]|uniref:Paraquat-inducible protein A n=1 Tax=Luteibacter rhizovicinus TaxID=242606 RepID=A0A4R3YKA9_9GAMM|nr:paraquat-inducible protein A [Luteibacter rhizovicinus]TCV91464.1 paraquat-inducible protein A [Luteibacter rhizovicinus]
MSALPRADELGIVGCHVCRQVSQASDDPHARCPRCGAGLHRRKRDSLARTWALLIAALLLYLPANIFPIMRTQSLFTRDDNTILSGVVELWRAGSPDLAIIVFTASIVVPVLKFLVMGYLLISVQRSSEWGARQRAKLFRLVEVVGYWSMLDVFVVALLSALVHFKVLSRVEPLPGVIFFGLVVVLTMLSAMSFDPRLIWDNRDSDD